MASLAPTQFYRGPHPNLWFLIFYLMASSTLAQHDSIPTAVEALELRSAGYNITFENTEDPTWFREVRLRKYDGVVFLSTTGEILDAEGKTAFQNYLNKGGNFVAIHSASDSLNTTTFYGQEVGAYFDYHPPISRATVNVLTKAHPSTSMLPDRWEVTDEMYNFKSDPRSVGAVVILSADESTYTDPGPRKFDQGQPHPTAWYQKRGAGVQSGGLAGRSFYTSLGHLNETWQDELFLSHVFGGITWALDSGTTKASNPAADLGRPATTSTSSSSLPNPSKTNAPSSTMQRYSVAVLSMVLRVHMAHHGLSCLPALNDQ
ncbi:class I glutamine amidotransferase-like protein [Thelephora ganbajun]|uniref:Class I glutamine amidotransferase-like protein n=1 Tax=Thelephora ganbajun TaxID=370292 RepID=A0ACB6ZGU8_THEGA|nr:class I glutamine amidotransferase-like protein [Thelephora ganbajun]